MQIKKTAFSLHGLYLWVSVKVNNSGQIRFLNNKTHNAELTYLKIY